MVIYVDIHHAHDREDFLAEVSRALRFPEKLTGDWKRLCRRPERPVRGSPRKAGWSFSRRASTSCGGHGHEATEALDVMDAAAEHWRGEGKPFWTLDRRARRLEIRLARHAGGVNRL